METPGMDGKINSLLKGVRETDRERIRKSVHAILQVYGLRPDDVSITRKRLDPSEIWVASAEECDPERAKRIMERKYRNTLPAPLTVLEYKGRNFLFMGHSRSVIFVLKGRMPDCLIVKIPGTVEKPIIISEARQTLKQIMEKQG